MMIFTSCFNMLESIDSDRPMMFRAPLLKVADPSGEFREAAVS